MKVKVISESGYTEALFGLGLSYGLTSDFEFAEFDLNLDGRTDEAYSRLTKLVPKLAHRDGGHNKFLESIIVWLDIDAPRYWWSEFDTYRVGMTKQSESTMHTLRKRELTPEDFEGPISGKSLDGINELIKAGFNIEVMKNALPEGFLQRRIVCTNYKSLRGMVWQREDHRLSQWKYFCHQLLEQLMYPEFIKENYVR